MTSSTGAASRTATGTQFGSELKPAGSAPRLSAYPAEWYLRWHLLGRAVSAMT